MDDRYTTAGVADELSEVDEAEESEKKDAPPVQNHEEKIHQKKEAMPDIEEEILAVDLADEATEPEQTENDGPTREDNENSGVHAVSPSGERWDKTVSARSGRRHNANITRRKGGGGLQPMLRREFTM